MGRELVKRISIRNDGKITVNSANSNWYPREYHTWEYTGTIEEAVKDILGNNLDIGTSCQGSFVEYLCSAIYEVSIKQYNKDVHGCIKDLRSIVYYSPQFDKVPPAEKAYNSYSEMMEILKDNIKAKRRNKNKFYISLNHGYLYKLPTGRLGSYKYTTVSNKTFPIVASIMSCEILKEARLIEL